MAGELVAVLGRPGGVARRRRPGSRGEAIGGLRCGALRRYQRELPPGQTGWLAGARELAVGRALTLMHHRSAHPWTLLSLAHEVGLSRSVLSERFRHYLGESPIAYLTRWRLRSAPARSPRQATPWPRLPWTSAMSLRRPSTGPSSASTVTPLLDTDASARRANRAPRSPSGRSVKRTGPAVKQPRARPREYANEAVRLRAGEELI